MGMAKKITFWEISQFWEISTTPLDTNNDDATPYVI